jgi:crotonobetainyl-CoA:carnitine CoA-transferase CaiB-like acyl-CoA transferase
VTEGPFHWLRVLDLGHNIAAPVSANLLGALGAQVVKVEHPDGGDNSRVGPPFVGSAGVHFDKAVDDDFSIAFLKRNSYKQGITLNLKDPDGRGLLLKLLEQFDVVIENFRPGVLERLGIGPEVMEQRNPRLIICSISGFGQTGPYRDWVAYDGIIQAFAGLVARTGYPDSPPVKSGFTAGDTLGALYSTLAIMAALERRRQTGHGERIEIALVDCVASALWDDPLDVFEAAGMPVRSGNNNQRSAPWNMYAATDGYVFICVLTNEQWSRLAQIAEIDRAPEFSTQVARLKNMKLLDSRIAGWCSKHPRDEIMMLLQAAQVPCSSVREPAELKRDPHLISRGVFHPLVHPDLGEISDVSATRLPFAARAESNSARAPRLGEHNAEIFGALGLSRDEIDSLTRRGVI